MRFVMCTQTKKKERGGVMDLAKLVRDPVTGDEYYDLTPWIRAQEEMEKVENLSKMTKAGYMRQRTKRQKQEALLEQAQRWSQQKTT